MNIGNFLRRAITPIVAATGVILGAACNAQTFGKPEDERKRIAPMAHDAEQLLELADKLRNIQKQKLISLAPIERKPRSVVERWKAQDEALSSYIKMFRELHGASAVLLNAVNLSLHVTERYLPPFNLGNICREMPGEMMLFTSIKERSGKDESIVRIYSFIGEETLERNEMALAVEGLRIADRLAVSFISLCNRARNPDNWIK
jgi:hypothetical protein